LIFSPNTTNSTQSDTFTLDLLSIKSTNRLLSKKK
jgi:hypothetical protein